MAEVKLEVVAAGVATAVAPDGELQPVQASLLESMIEAVTGARLDLCGLDPVGPDQLATALSDAPAVVRHRAVHLMVLGELILRPVPLSVATRVGKYAGALGVDDRFVRVAHRYSQGAFGLAWEDLKRSGFAEHWEAARMDQLKSSVRLPDQLSPGVEDPDLAGRWVSFEQMAPGSLGRRVWEMYHGRGFSLPGLPGGASAYLAQHDFVHVLADYGTNLNGEMEVFAMIGRADPDPKGFAWLTTLIGLFQTGYVANAGFFSGDLRERRLDSREAHVRLSDAYARGAALCERMGTDLLEVDYHDYTEWQVVDVRAEFGIPEKSEKALAAGSCGAFDVEGMSLIQQQYAKGLSA